MSPHIPNPVPLAPLGHVRVGARAARLASLLVPEHWHCATLLEPASTADIYPCQASGLAAKGRPAGRRVGLGLCTAPAAGAPYSARCGHSAGPPGPQKQALHNRGSVGRLSKVFSTKWGAGLTPLSAASPTPCARGRQRTPPCMQGRRVASCYRSLAHNTDLTTSNGSTTNPWHICTSAPPASWMGKKHGPAGATNS